MYHSPPQNEQYPINFEPQYSSSNKFINYKSPRVHLDLSNTHEHVGVQLAGAFLGVKDCDVSKDDN